MLAIGTGGGAADRQAGCRLAQARSDYDVASVGVQSRTIILESDEATFGASPRAGRAIQRFCGDRPKSVSTIITISPRGCAARGVLGQRCALAAEAALPNHHPHARGHGMTPSKFSAPRVAAAKASCIVSRAMPCRRGQALDAGFHLAVWRRADVSRKPSRGARGGAPSHRADRLADRDRLPYLGACAASRQTQTRPAFGAGDRCAGWPKSGASRLRKIAARTADNFERALFAGRDSKRLNWGTKHEFRQAGAGPGSAGNFRSGPERPGTGGEEDFRRVGGFRGRGHGHRALSAIGRRQAVCAPRCC